MGPVYLFDIASSHAQWLSLRQAAISSNVANANTPAYRAQDIEPFNKMLDSKVVAVAVTDPEAHRDRYVPAGAGHAKREELGSRPLRQLRQPGAGDAEGRRRQQGLFVEHRDRQIVSPHVHEQHEDLVGGGQ